MSDMRTNHPEITKPRLQSRLVTQITYIANHPDRLSQYNKPLPMFAKDFKPSKGMIPATVFIGSHDAITATKAARLHGSYSTVCIKPSDHPSKFRWGFLHSLPVLIYAEEDLPVEIVHDLIRELDRCGASHITALRLSGKFIALYSPKRASVTA